MSTEALVHGERALLGSADLEGVVARHGGTCLARAQLMLLDTADAEQALVEACLTVSRRGLPAAVCSSAVLARLTYRAAVDRLHERSGRALTSFRIDLTRPTAVEDEGDEGLGLEALRRLPPVQGQVVALAWWGGLTLDEIAVLTDAPLPVVRQRVLAGMLGLRRQLEADRLEAEAVQEGAAR